MGGAGCEAGAYAKTKKGRRRDAIDLFPVTYRASSPGAVVRTPPTHYSAWAAYWGFTLADRERRYAGVTHKVTVAIRNPYESRRGCSIGCWPKWTACAPSGTDSAGSSRSSIKGPTSP